MPTEGHKSWNFASFLITNLCAVLEDRERATYIEKSGVFQIKKNSNMLSHFKAPQFVISLKKHKFSSDSDVEFT